MMREDGKVVGICSAGSTLDGGDRNLALRSRHVVETIKGGRRFDSSTMSNSASASSAASPEASRALGDLLRRFPDAAMWNWSDMELESLKAEFATAQAAGNTMVLAGGWIESNLQAHRSFTYTFSAIAAAYPLANGTPSFVFVSPREAIDIDLQVMDNLGAMIVHSSDSLHYYWAAGHLDPLKAPRAPHSMNIVNAGSKETDVLILVFQ